MKVGGKRRESERDFSLESFRSPLTSINPLDFHCLMGVKLRTDEESRQIWDQRLSVKPVGTDGGCFLQSLLEFYISANWTWYCTSECHVQSACELDLGGSGFSSFIKCETSWYYLYIPVYCDWSRYLSWIMTRTKCCFCALRESNHKQHKISIWKKKQKRNQLIWYKVDSDVLLWALVWFLSFRYIFFNLNRLLSVINV